GATVRVDFYIFTLDGCVCTCSLYEGFWRRGHRLGPSTGLHGMASVLTPYPVMVVEGCGRTEALCVEDDRLVTGADAPVRVHPFSLRAVIFCVAGIHSEQIACKYLGLISARSTSYFDDDVFVIIWIFRKE